MDKKVSGESVVKEIRRRTRKKYSSEEKNSISNFIDNAKKNIVLIEASAK
jgi:hypothetical protein